MSKSETAEAVQHAADGADPDEHPWLAARRGQRRWIPSIASLLCLLIGLSDVLAIFSPGFHACPPPSIQRSFLASMMLLTHASNTRSIMRRSLLFWRQASPGKDR